jgi:uncharacterized membrane protein YdjX (TVP38/TMEM64 family)
VTPERRRALYFRLGAVALVAVALLLIGHLLGVDFSTTKIRSLATSAGLSGVAIYLGLWIVGNLVYVPGLVFVAAGVLAWGHWWGGLAAYGGAFLAAICSFTIVRAVGGKPLAEVTSPRVQRILQRIEKRPILAVAFVRSFSMSAPWINYALALSPIPWVPHLIGTVLGLIPSVGVMSALFGVLFK